MNRQIIRFLVADFRCCLVQALQFSLQAVDNAIFQSHTIYSLQFLFRFVRPHEINKSSRFLRLCFITATMQILLSSFHYFIFIFHYFKCSMTLMRSQKKHGLARECRVTWSWMTSYLNQVNRWSRITKILGSRQLGQEDNFLAKIVYLIFIHLMQRC